MKVVRNVKPSRYADAYLRNLTDEEFKALAEDYQKICETGIMEENSLFGKFSETYTGGKEPDKYILSQVVFGQEAVRRCLKLMKN